MLRTLIALCLAASPAIAAPPPVGSEDWEIMHDYREWIEGQQQPSGYSCCDFADGRPVEARIEGGHWQVFVTEAKFPRSRTGWVTVADDRVLRNPNPVGVPIAWVIQGMVLCFAPSSGI